jgi:hypothetical protein
VVFSHVENGHLSCASDLGAFFHLFLDGAFSVLERNMMKLFDPIRKKAVADTPEERVRQGLLIQMLGPLGFPKGLIAVEQVLAHGRRADIVVYRSDGSPLLLVECKVDGKDAEVAFRQALGYNASLKCPFWCLAHEGGVETFWMEKEMVRSVLFLPQYVELKRH